MEVAGQQDDARDGAHSRAREGATPPSSGEANPSVVWLWLLLALNALLAWLAYGPLLETNVRRLENSQLEGLFFTPSQTAPAVVICLSLWLLYRRKARLLAIEPRTGSSLLWLPLFALAAGVSGWATFTGATDLLVPSLALNVLGVAAFYGGASAMRVVALPVAFLVFALPMPGPPTAHLLLKLQLWTAQYAGFLLLLLGVPSFVSGDLIFQSSQTFAVIEGCSGLRSMETLTMLSVLMVDLFRRHGVHAAIIVGGAPLVAFALNGVRVLTLILNPHSKVAEIHTIQGIAILLSGLVLLYLVDGVLGRWLADRPGPQARGTTLPPGGVIRTPAVAAATLAVCAAISFWLPHWETPQTPYVRLGNQIPSELAGWIGSDVETDRVFLGLVALGQSVERRYEAGRHQVDVFVGLGDHARRLQTLFSPKTALPGSGWIVEETGRARLADGSDIATSVVRRRTERRLVYHWYEGSRSLAVESLRTLLALDASPLQRARDGVVVRLSTPLHNATEADRERAARVLQSFYSVLRPELDALARRTRKRFSSASTSRKTFSSRWSTRPNRT